MYKVFFSSSSHHLFHSLLLSEEPHLLPIPHLPSIFLQTWKAASSFSLQKVPPLLPGPASLPPLPCHTQVHLWTLTAHILNLNHFPPPRGHIEYPRPMTCSNYFASLRKLKALIYFVFIERVAQDGLQSDSIKTPRTHTDWFTSNGRAVWNPAKSGDIVV